MVKEENPFKEFGEMISEDLKKKGEIDSRGVVSIKGVKDNVSITKMNKKIFANLSVSNYEELKENYSAVNIDDIIERKIKYYKIKPFQSRTKEVWVEKIKDWIQFVNTDFPEDEAKQKKWQGGHNEYSALTRRGQIETFWKDQPFFYDIAKLFWIWNKELLRWEVSDEIDFLNSIQESLGVETIETKTKTEFITGFKQVGRKHKPKDAPKHWVQFKEKIYDLKTGENFEASHEYFMTNPIPFNIGESNETPTIDKYFKEWVGEKHMKELYEITAYSITPDKFMQRMFALVGGGSNGKGTFIKLLEHFLGKENCVSSSLKAISEDKFEIAVLYRKLLCVMGEVSSNDLRDTNQVKRIAGEDTMSFQFKGKTPFSDYMTTTCLCATNSLPTTPDKSLGFYRKWHILDFPNQFKAIKKDLIESIPKEEWENLAFRSLEELKKLYEIREFSNEGDFEERVKRYEERSNPVMRFVEEFFEEIPGENIPLRDFTKLVNDYLREKHLRVLSAIQVGKILRNDGFGVSQRRIEDVSQVVILNMSQRENHSNHPNHPNSEPFSICNSIQNSNGSNGSNGFTKEELDKASPEFRKMLENGGK